jgi:hypothetical protein
VLTGRGASYTAERRGRALLTVHNTFCEQPTARTSPPSCALMIVDVR